MLNSREFMGGWVAGAAGQTVGHPLDTIKVRMQTGAGGRYYAGGWHCAADAFRRDGGRVFFRGLSLPLMSKSVEQCVSFGVRGVAARVLQRGGIKRDSLRSWMAGACAGAVNAVIMTPVYLVKVQLQTSSRAGLRGPIDAVRATIARCGVRGMYTGAAPILCGCVIGASSRYATYDGAVRAMKSHRLNDTLAVACGGGLAGLASWASHYPLDLVSARMQAAAARDTPTPRTALAQLRDIVHRSGVAGLFRGIGPCLARAFPVNATVFLTYEMCVQQQQR